MSGSTDVRAHADRLRAAGVPFVLATVVRAERPTSAKPGAHAVVEQDGRIIGFVGGECAQASVRTQAVAAMQAGEPVLVRIVPDVVAPESPGGAEGVVTVHNPCLSGGTLEVFLEPTLPARRMVVHGASPIAHALADLARHLGYAVDDDSDVDSGEGGQGERIMPDAVVVASHGEDETAPLIAAVRAGVPYVGLVASRRRGPQVIAALDLTEEEKQRIRTPAGLDIGAKRPQDVAVSIVAEIIATSSRLREADEPRRAEDSGVPQQRAAVTAIDTVCGMTVAAVEATLHVDVDGVRYWFCGSGCRDAFVADPAAFTGR